MNIPLSTSTPPHPIPSPYILRKSNSQATYEYSPIYRHTHTPRYKGFQGPRTCRIYFEFTWTNLGVDGPLHKRPWHPWHCTHGVCSHGICSGKYFMDQLDPLTLIVNSSIQYMMMIHATHAASNYPLPPPTLLEDDEIEYYDDNDESLMTMMMMIHGISHTWVLY